MAAHFSLGSQNGRMLHWMRCSLFWLTSCWREFYRSQHKGHTTARTACCCHFFFFCASSETLPLERLELIVWYLHFFDNSTVNEYQGPAKIFKIYPILQHLNKELRNLYLQDQDIAIEESLTVWKGWLSFRQYIPLKVSEFGIKSY
jgi:hypothetical protein